MQRTNVKRYWQISQVVLAVLLLLLLGVCSGARVSKKMSAVKRCKPLIEAAASPAALHAEALDVSKLAKAEAACVAELAAAKEPDTNTAAIYAALLW